MWMIAPKALKYVYEMTCFGDIVNESTCTHTQTHTLSNILIGSVVLCMCVISNQLLDWKPADSEKEFILYDFAGQQEYSHFHGQFFSSSALCVLVFSLFDWQVCMYVCMYVCRYV